jgi:hypothetical protein
MRPIGFSTGALALGDFALGLSLIRQANLPVVELSALREPEVEPLVASLETLDLTGFTYVAVHAPSRIDPANERAIVARLAAFATRGWPIVMHPDAIHDVDAWRPLGPTLCLENMDSRKPTGRNVKEMREWFARLPEAGFCLDLGHARQWDPSMTEAYFLLKTFRSRLRQIHLSEVTSTCKHERLNRLAIRAFQDIAANVDEGTPIILESIIPPQELAGEIERAREALRAPTTMGRAVRMEASATI